MKTCPFSVLLSLYAREQPDWLKACLDSICAQSVQPEQIIIVLDGAINAALHSVLESYQTKLPLQIIAIEQHVGLGNALNIGLNHCQHEWVLRMDTDDICAPERFALQWNHIQQHPELALFSGQIAEFSASPDQASNVRQVPLTDHAIRQYLISEWQLLRLKNQLHSQPLLAAFGCFMLRGSSRLLPTALLSNLYHHLRLNK